jgi:hypothetical protein
MEARIMTRYHITDDTLVYAASAGAPECDAFLTVVGFSPSAVDAEITKQVRAEQNYNAEQCTVTEPDGTERDAEPEDFPYWITDAMEFKLGDVIGPDEYESMRELARDGLVVVSR